MSQQRESLAQRYPFLGGLWVGLLLGAAIVVVSILVGA